MTQNGTVNHFTVLQVSRFVGVRRQAVQRRIAKGQLVAVDVLGVQMIPVSSVEQWQSEREARAQMQLEKVTQAKGAMR